MEAIKTTLESCKRNLINIVNCITFDNAETISESFKDIMEATKATMINQIKCVVAQNGNSVRLVEATPYNDNVDNVVEAKRLYIDKDILYLEYEYTDWFDGGEKNTYDDNLFVFNMNEINKIGIMLEESIKINDIVK